MMRHWPLVAHQNGGDPVWGRLCRLLSSQAARVTALARHPPVCHRPVGQGQVQALEHCLYGDTATRRGRGTIDLHTLLAGDLLRSVERQWSKSHPGSTGPRLTVIQGAALLQLKVVWRRRALPRPYSQEVMCT